MSSKHSIERIGDVLQPPRSKYPKGCSIGAIGRSPLTYGGNVRISRLHPEREWSKSCPVLGLPSLGDRPTFPFPVPYSIFLSHSSYAYPVTRRFLYALMPFRILPRIYLNPKPICHTTQNSLSTD